MSYKLLIPHLSDKVRSFSYLMTDKNGVELKYEFDALLSLDVHDTSIYAKCRCISPVTGATDTVMFEIGKDELFVSQEDKPSRMDLLEQRMEELEKKQ